MLLRILRLEASLLMGLAVGLGSIGFVTAMASHAQTTPATSDDVVVETEPQPGTQSPGSRSQLPVPSPDAPAVSTTTRFACEIRNGEYTVMYRPESQPGQAYAWATPSAMGGGWSPDRRCAEITRRLESYRPDGLLEMRTSVENGYNTICVTTQAVSGCRIVLTVPPGQDPTLTRDRVFQNLTTADAGTQTQAVNTFTGSGTDPIVGKLGQLLKLPGFGGSRSRTESINLRPFLDRADGGTAANLRPTRTPRLNPTKFR